jgi:polyisoprenyl-teichoic acid--peptidoglycan teichoic acid transferase
VGDARPDGGRTPAEAAPRARRAPLWARVCAVVGAVVMLMASGLLVGKELLVARYAGAVQIADLFGDAPDSPDPGEDIKGPLNILLVGIDPRASEPNWVPRADSILILHVPAGLDRGYLFSLPRDLLVDIPPFPASNWNGGRAILAHAMFHGARVPGQERPDAAQGFQLLAKTISDYTGIERLDAGAIVNFTGFKRIVDAMDGVDLYIDQRVVSIHMQPDGQHRAAQNGAPHGYVGPQKVYEKGWAHLSGWEALDYTRQRYIEGGDYARQRHQQQFIRAMVKKATSLDVITNPLKLDAVLRAAGDSVIFNGRGHSVVDFAFALKGLGSESLVTVKLPGRSVIVNGDYRGERLEPISEEFLAAVRTEQVDTFMGSHPELINAVNSD